MEYLPVAALNPVPNYMRCINPHMPPSFCRGRRITRCGGLNMGDACVAPTMPRSVFPSVRLATVALQRPRGERWRHIRVVENSPEAIKTWLSCEVLEHWDFMYERHISLPMDY